MSEWVVNRWPQRLQFRAQLDVIEDLAVEDDPEGAILVGDGLLAAAQIDDAEAGVAQADRAIQIDAELVRPAMADHGQHPAQVGLINGFPAGCIQFADDAAHAISSGEGGNEQSGRDQLTRTGGEWRYAAERRLPSMSWKTRSTCSAVKPMAAAISAAE